jgi:hypothetical protein
VARHTTDEPNETLRRFVHHVDQLRARRIIREEDLRSSLNLNASRETPLQVSHHEPDEEDLRSYLLDFRKFIAEQEPVFLNRVLNVAQRHVTSDEILGGIAGARSAWKDVLQKGDLAYRVNQTPLTPELVLDLWINGWYFHNDASKRRRLDALTRVPMSRWLFINAVVSATKVILYVGHVVKIALREGLVSATPIRG